jgi:hypothetical protein
MFHMSGGARLEALQHELHEAPAADEAVASALEDNKRSQRN